MNVEQIKNEITLLAEAELNELAAFLFHLRHRHDGEYQSLVEGRLRDESYSNWHTIEEFEQELEMLSTVNSD